MKVEQSQHPGEPLFLKSQSRLPKVQLVSDRDSIIVCQKECQAVRWCVPQDILALGQIMELSRLIPILRLAGSASPQVPAGFVLQELPLPSGDQT